MHTTGEQNYWKSPEPSTEPSAQPVSQYAGYDMNESPEPAEETPHFEPLQWQASEYVHSEKNILWFVYLGLATLFFGAIAILLLKSWTFTILVFVMAAATGFLAHRPPRALNYSLQHDGLFVEDRKYDFGEFRAFAILKDGPLAYVMLLPVKRFSPAVTLYFPPENAEQIVDVLGSVMPLEKRDPDILDRAARKLRF